MNIQGQLMVYFRELDMVELKWQEYITGTVLEINNPSLHLLSPSVSCLSLRM